MLHVAFIGYPKASTTLLIVQSVVSAEQNQTKNMCRATAQFPPLAGRATVAWIFCNSAPHGLPMLRIVMINTKLYGVLHPHSALMDSHSTPPSHEEHLHPLVSRESCDRTCTVCTRCYLYLTVRETVLKRPTHCSAKKCPERKQRAANQRTAHERGRWPSRDATNLTTTR